MGRAGRFAAAIFLAMAGACGAALSGERGAPAGDFGFYVLSLTWSPSYCALEGPDANRRQCGGGHDYTFIVHGLWPQYEDGYPEYCPSGRPQRVPDGLVAQYLDIMPSAGLIGHQWRKHGVCSGLSQADYFALLRKARQRVAVPVHFRALAEPRLVSPEAVEQSFIDANPGLPRGGVAVTCQGRHLREVRICMGEDLAFRACRAVDENDCRRERILMPPAPDGPD